MPPGRPGGGLPRRAEERPGAGAEPARVDGAPPAPARAPGRAAHQPLVGRARDRLPAALVPSRRGPGGDRAAARQVADRRAARDAAGDLLALAGAPTAGGRVVVGDVR